MVGPAWPSVAGPPDRKRRPRVTLALAVSVSVTGATLALVWWRHDLDLAAVLASSAAANVPILAAVLVGSAVFQAFVGAHKLHCILRALGVGIGYRETLRLRLGGASLRAFLPLGLGEVAQVVYLKRHKAMTVGGAASAAALDRGLNLFGALVWLAVGIAVFPRPGAAARLAPLAALLGLVGLGLFFAPLHALLRRAGAAVHDRVGRFAADALAPVDAISPGWKVLLLGYGVVFQLRPVLACLLVVRAFGIGLGPDVVLLHAAAAVLAGQIPGFLVGAGPREAVIVELLRGHGAAPAALFGAGIVTTFSITVFPALACAPFTPWLLRRLGRPRVDGGGEP